MWIRLLSDDIAYVPMQWVWMVPQLVAVSVAVSIATAMLAFGLSSMARQSSRHRTLKQSGAVLCLGGGVWSMHFIGMQAFTPCGSGDISWLHSALSALPGLLAAAVLVRTLSRAQPSRISMLLSGLFFGAAVVVTHFWGMRAAEATHYMDYPLFGVLLALTFGVAMAMCAVALFCHMRTKGMDMLPTVLLCGSVLGLSTASMHYIAMDAIHMPVGPDPTHSVPLESHWTLLSTTASALLVLVLVLLAAGIALRRRKRFAEAQRS